MSEVRSEAMEPEKKKLRGFARLSIEERQELARKGGQAAHRKGVAHKFTEEEARLAGKKGGKATARDREHMSAIGKIGGASGKRRLEKITEIAKQKAENEPETSL